MSSKMSMSFFLQSKKIKVFDEKLPRIFLHIMQFTDNKMVQGPNESFSTASKGFKQHQTIKKGLIKRSNLSFKK